MKTFTAVLSVLFVVVFCYQATSSPLSLNHYSPCCAGYITRPLPLSRVRCLVGFTGGVGQLIPLSSLSCFPSPHWTSFSRFTTIKDRPVCANPNDKWVQDIINQLKDKKHSG
ncbi:C-C motif chemokine 5-like [Sylvia atricapilla]|uniref:C-C motif chemokine 5-like n=1 Tax=Sylvia atricapilla TaxID=48155 RepID=UPI0033992C0D